MEAIRDRLRSTIEEVCLFFFFHLCFSSVDWVGFADVYRLRTGSI